MNYRDLRAEFGLLFDPGDPWGSTMGWRFDIAAELYLRGAEVPEGWEYRPSPGMTEREDTYEAEIAAQCDTESLVRFGNVLQRYDRLLRRAGMDY